jgi:hypothetical protein
MTLGSFGRMPFGASAGRIDEKCLLIDCCALVLARHFDSLLHEMAEN